MDYWKEAEKIYTDLERKGYRMIFDNNYSSGYYRSGIMFREKGAKQNGIILTIRFNFRIEELLIVGNKEELEEKFVPNISIHIKPEAKQLYDYMINEFEYHCPKISNSLMLGSQCGDPLKMFHFYVTVAQKYYSSVISKAKEMVIEEG